MNTTPDEDRMEAIRILREAFHNERKVTRAQAKTIEELQEIIEHRIQENVDTTIARVKPNAWYVIHMILMLMVVAPLAGSFLAYHGLSWWWSGLLVPLMFWGIACYLWNDHMRRRREEEAEKAEEGPST